MPMVSRRELDELSSAQAAISKAAQTELRQLFGALSGLDDPALIRDALLDAIPGLTAKYGDLTGAVALEWFEDVYEMPATLSTSLDIPAIQSNVRYTAGHLWTDTPANALGPLLTTLDKVVRQPGRDTIARSAEQHGMNWVRVPRGAKTCAFCLTLASRGSEIIALPGDWSYRSKKSALYRADGGRYHGDCDCEAMPLRPDESMPSGYDPDRMYGMYRNATDTGMESEDAQRFAASLKGDPNKDLKMAQYNMRRLYPDMVTDAVHAH